MEASEGVYTNPPKTQKKRKKASVQGKQRKRKIPEQTDERQIVVQRTFAQKAVQLIKHATAFATSLPDEKLDRFESEILQLKACVNCLKGPPQYKDFDELMEEELDDQNEEVDDEGVDGRTGDEEDDNHSGGWSNDSYLGGQADDNDDVEQDGDNDVHQEENDNDEVEHSGGYAC